MSGFESIVGIDPWTALFTFLNMIITFLILKKFLFVPVKKMIDSRQKEIDDLYSDANDSKEKAEEMLVDYKKKIENYRQEGDEIIKNATTRGEKREQEIISKANAQAEAIISKAHEDVMQEKKKVLNEVKNEISDIAIEIAEKVIEKEIDEEKHKSLVEEFINNIGDEK